MLKKRLEHLAIKDINFLSIFIDILGYGANIGSS